MKEYNEYKEALKELKIKLVELTEGNMAIIKELNALAYNLLGNSKDGEEPEKEKKSP